MPTAQEYSQAFQRELFALVDEHDQQMKTIGAPLLTHLEFRRETINYYTYGDDRAGCRFGLPRVTASYEFEHESSDGSET